MSSAREYPLKVEVIEVRETGDLLNFNVTPAKHVTVARIKVVSRVKGAVPGEIEMRFPAYEQQRLSFDGEDNHDHIQLEKGKHYRFYLKRVAGELWYATAAPLMARRMTARRCRPMGTPPKHTSVASGNIGGKTQPGIWKRNGVELTVTDGKSKRPRLVCGVIEKVESTTVTVFLDSAGNAPAKQVTFSKTDISKVQLLPDSHPAQ